MIGCHAQTPSTSGKPVPPEVAWRIEALLRTNANLPAATEISIGERKPSDLAGYDEVPVTFKVDGQTSPPSLFLLSTDNKTFAQMHKFDISQDPRLKVNGEGRPGRGGPASAPVQIVSFDDLECPFCARLHGELFPAMLQRYGDSIHVAYRNFPLSQHPWAMRAAVDVDCLGAQSPAGYWNLVDFMHAHAGDLWDNDAKSLPKTNDQLDLLARDEGKRQHVDAARLDACIAKQDTTAIQASIKLGESLGVGATPALFINGNRIDGAVPLEFIYKIIDNALIVAGKTPPPPYVPPAASTPVANSGH